MPDGLPDLSAAAINQPKAAKRQGDPSVPKIVDDELAKLGWSDNARLSMLGNVGRENSWNRQTIFNGHEDPANGEFNRGIISWQGARRQKLDDYLKQQGVYGQNNDDEIRGMVRFMDQEIQSSPEWKNIHSAVRDPNISTAQASKALQKYIKYSPAAPYNTPDPNFNVKANAAWADRARSLGLGQLPDLSGATSLPDLSKLNLNKPASKQNLAQPAAPQQPVAPQPVPQVQPETPNTIQAQVQSLLNPQSPRSAVLLTDPSQMPMVNNLGNMAHIRVPEGLLVVDPKKAGVRSRDIQAYVKKNGFAGLIGKVDDVGNNTATGPALVTKDANGNELSASIVTSPESAQKQAQVDKAQFPQAATQEIKPARAVVNDRTQPALSDEPKISDAEETVITPEQQAQINANAAKVPIVGTVDVDPKLDPEEKIRQAANKLLVGRLTPTGAITSEDIDKWIQASKDAGVPVFLGNPDQSTVTIRQDMLDQIFNAKKKSREQLAEELKQRTIAPPSDDLLRQQAIEQLNEERRAGKAVNQTDVRFGAEPQAIAPITEDEVQAKIADLKAQEQSPESKSAAYDVAQKAGAGEAGVYGGVGQILQQAGGALRPFGLGESISGLGKEMQLVSGFRHHGEGSQGVGENVAGFLGESIPQLAELITLPGGAVGKFAALGGLGAAGAGKNASEIAKETVKGAATGKVFELAGEMEKPLARLGTVFGGSAAINAASGEPIDQNLKSSIVNTLFEAQGIYGDKLAGKFFQFWKGGESLTVGVTPKGEVIVPKTDVPTENKIVLDPENPVYKSVKPTNETKTEVPSQPASIPPSTNVPAAETETPGTGKELSAEPRTVSHPNPAIDGKQIVGETEDGRVVVPNPDNKTGVSVVKDRGETKNDLPAQESGGTITANEGNTAKPEEGQPVRESRAPKGGTSQGKETSVRIPDSKDSYKAKYVVRELDDVVPSHNPFNFQPNPDYYYTNDRHYDKESQYQEQVRTRSKGDQFDPNQLINNSPTSETGPPIIDADGNALGGNSRAMMLHRIFADEDPRAREAYLKQLNEDAGVYGIKPEDIYGMKRPVLVREISDDSIDAQHAITDLNKSSTTALTSSERSIAEAGKLSEDAADYIAGKIEATGPDSTLSQALDHHGKDVVNKLIDEGVFQPGDRNTLLDGGKITADGKARIERLLTGRVFTDLQQLEYAPDYVKQKIQRAIAPLVKIEGDKAWNLLPETREAIDLLTEYKGKGGDATLEEYAKTPSFVRPEPWSPRAIAIAEKLRQSPNEVSKAFKTYAGEFQNAKNGGGLFGASTPEQAFDTAFKGKESKSNEYGSKNTIVTKDEAEAARELLKKKLSESTKLYSGAPLEPEVLKALAKLAAFHVEAGARSFADFSAKMIKEVGDQVKPYLTSLYNDVKAKHDFEGMEKVLPEDQVKTEPRQNKLFPPEKGTEEPQNNPTSIKNSTVDAEREERGLPPAMKAASKEFGTSWNEAMKRIEEEPDVQRNLIDELKKKPRPISDVENALLLHRQIDLRNRFDAEADTLAKAVEKNDEEGAAEARVRLAPISDQLQDVYDVGRAAGTENARGLATRRMLVNEDFSLASLERQTRAANGGRQLDTDEITKLKQVADDYKSKNEELEKHLSEKDDRIAQIAADRAIEQMKLPSTKVIEMAEKIVTKLENRADAARERLKKRGNVFSSGLDPVALKDLAEIGASHVAKLGLDFAKFSEQMVKEFGEKIKPHLDHIWKASNDVLDKFDPSFKDTLGKNASPEEIGAKVKEKVAAGDMPGASPLIQKLAKKFVAQGITKREDLIDAVHNVVKDAIPERRDVMDAISGYGQFRPLSKDAIDVQLRDLKGQMQQIAKLEDMAAGKAPAKTGLERRSPSDEERHLQQQVEEAKRQGGYKITDPATQLKTALAAAKTRLENQIKDLETQIANRQKIVKTKTRLQLDEEGRNLQAQRDSLKKQFEEVFGKSGLSDEQRLRNWKRNAENRKAELQTKLATGDFTKRQARPPIQLDEQGMKLKADIERLKVDFLRGLHKERMKNRSMSEKAQDLFVKFRRGSLLSSPVTLAKLTMAAASRVTITPAEQAVGTFWSTVFPKIAAKATREAGFNTKAEAKALTETFMKGIGDAWKTIKTGDSDLTMAFGKTKIEMERSWMDFAGTLHAALKAPVKRNEFTRSFEMRMTKALNDGVDVTDPLVQTQIAMDAYKDANRAIFMQDNKVVQLYNRAVRDLEQPDKNGVVSPYSKAGSTILKTLLPIVKIPTNYAFETARYAFGVPAAAYDIAKAYRAGIDSLKPEEADLIMRSLKKGSLGAAAFALGAFNPNMFGGYYQSGEKRDEKDVQAGGIRMFGYDIPKWATHNPLFEVMQMGGTFRRVADSKLRKKDKETQGYAVGFVAGGLGLSEEIPFIREITDIAKIYDVHERKLFFGETAKSLAAPALFQWIAEHTDKDANGKPIKRKPDSIWQYIESGYPVLRKNVPVVKKKH
jgi:hypothetical protein